MIASRIVRRHRCIAALSVCMTLALSTSVEAQRVAIAYFRFPVFGATDVYNLGTGVLEFREFQAASALPVFTADGRFLVLRFDRSSGLLPLLQIRDLLTGQRASFELAFEPLRAHPRRLAIYGLVPGGIARLDASGLRPYASCDGSPLQIDLTVDGSRLFVFCESGTIETIDEATGALVGVVVAGSSPLVFRGFSVNGDGSQVLVLRASELVLFDAATGTEILATPIPGPPPPPPFSGPGSSRIVSAAPVRDAAVVSTVWTYDDGLPGSPMIYSFRTQILDFITFTPGRQLAVPYDPVMMAISPDATRAFVGSRAPDPRFALLQDIDLNTGQPTLATSLGSLGWLGAAFPPLPPTLRPAVVNAQQVTISWHLAAHSPAAEVFAIQVGTRSGATDLGTVNITGAGSVAVADVPPGRYFVRVKAVNVTGTSSASNEIVIDVPAAASSGQHLH